jgi:hypothetical protein
VLDLSRARLGSVVTSDGVVVIGASRPARHGAVGQAKGHPGTYHVLAIYHPGTDCLPEESSRQIVAVSNLQRLEITEPVV